MWIKRGKNRFNKYNPTYVDGIGIGSNGNMFERSDQRLYVIEIALNVENVTISWTKSLNNTRKYGLCNEFPNINTVLSDFVTTSDYMGKITNTMQSSGYKYLLLSLIKNDVVDDLQVEYGTEATGYESYMDTTYNMKENGEFTEISSVAVGTVAPDRGEKLWIKRGKNRYNKNDAPKLNMYVNVSENKIGGELATSRSTYMSIEPNKTYTISKIAGKAFRVATTSSEPRKDTSIISTVANHEGTSITITTESNAKYLFINYYSSANGDTESEDVLRSSLQVVEGSEVLPFEEYIDTKMNIKENNQFKEIFNIDRNNKLKEGVLYSVSDSIKFKAGGSNDYSLYKIGNVVNLILAVDYGGNIPSTNTLVGMLPSGFRPIKSFTCMVGLGDSTNYGWTIDGTGYGLIYDQGHIHVRNTTGKSYRYAFFCISFMTSE